MPSYIQRQCRPHLGCHWWCSASLRPCRTQRNQWPEIMHCPGKRCWTKGVMWEDFLNTFAYVYKCKLLDSFCPSQRTKLWTPRSIGLWSKNDFLHHIKDMSLDFPAPTDAMKPESSIDKSPSQPLLWNRPIIFKTSASGFTLPFLCPKKWKKYLAFAVLAALQKSPFFPILPSSASSASSARSARSPGCRRARPRPAPRARPGNPPARRPAPGAAAPDGPGCAEPWPFQRRRASECFRRPSEVHNL